VTATIKTFQAILVRMGSVVTYHREAGGVVCPCRSREGFRSPVWHKANPEGIANPALAGLPWNGINPPECNEEGFQGAIVTEFFVRAAVQPVRSSTRRVGERAQELFGVIEQDDHLGIFPVTWQGNMLNFHEWSTAGEDYIVYNDRRFAAVAADKLPDVDGDPNHHWEVGLRLLKPEAERPV
jgi:hypothetical protein